MSGLTKEGLNKFGLKQTVFGSGVIGIDQYVIKGEHFFRVVTEGAAPTHEVKIEGRIGTAPLELLTTVVGSDSVTFDTTTYDFIRFTCTVFGGITFNFHASGFYIVPATLEELDDLLSAIKDRKSTRLNSSHSRASRMPSSA